MGKERTNIRKLIEIQIALQGTEKEIDKIIKKITDISKREEVRSYSISEK